jgi:PAS domain S-box-containing protein
LLGVFAARAGAELDRLRLESEKRRAVAILEEATDLVAWSDPAGNIRYMNAALRRLRGIDRDTPLDGMRVGEFHAPWARRLIEDVGMPAAIAGGMWVGEAVMVGADGAQKTMSQLIMAHRNASGEVEYLSTIMRDLTEQKRTEAALREREAGLRMAQQVGKVGSWEHDLSSNRLTWSEETFRIIGADPATFVPTRESLLERVHPEDISRLEQASEDAQAGLSPFAIDYRVLLPDGAVRHVHARADVMFDERAGRGAWSGRSGHHRAQARRGELKASEQRFRRLVRPPRSCPGPPTPSSSASPTSARRSKIAGTPRRRGDPGSGAASSTRERDAIIEFCREAWPAARP